MDPGTSNPDISTQDLLATPPAPLLVIDDEPMVREVVTRYLEQDGHRVTTVADGPSARDALAHRSFDLIVLDLMLPGVDGLSILRELRRTDQAPVVVLTARGDEADRILGLEPLGARRGYPNLCRTLARWLVFFAPGAGRWRGGLRESQVCGSRGGVSGDVGDSEAARRSP